MASQKESKLNYRPCVGAMIMNKEGLVLVGERIDTKNAWQLPQGGIDKGETPQQAILREIKEELGIENPQKSCNLLYESSVWHSYNFPRKLTYQDGEYELCQYQGQTQKWFLFKLAHNYNESIINLDIVEHKEFSRVDWVEMSILLNLIIAFKKQVYEKIVKEFSIFLSKTS